MAWNVKCSLFRYLEPLGVAEECDGQTEWSVRTVQAFHRRRLRYQPGEVVPSSELKNYHRDPETGVF